VRVFSGIQPTGAIHLGNYAGAIRNWVQLQEENECIFCIVDYHAMTMPYEPKELQRKIHEAALDVLACGVDPEKSIFYVQSAVPQHTELAWILSCVAPMGELNRMTQFKEKSERLESVNVGLFTYPVLQAADILLYKGEAVPVGEDQLQHLEITREIARRFNGTFGGEILPEPKPLLTSAPRIMSMNDPTRKMSKSLEGSAIMLGDTDDAIKKAVKRAVTDVGPKTDEMSPGVQNLFVLLEVFGTGEAHRKLMADYEAGGLRYSDLKGELTEALLAWIGPVRERRAELAARPGRVKEILAAGGAECRKRADATLKEVRAAAGLD